MNLCPADLVFHRCLETRTWQQKLRSGMTNAHGINIGADISAISEGSVTRIRVQGAMNGRLWDGTMADGSIV